MSSLILLPAQMDGTMKPFFGVAWKSTGASVVSMSATACRNSFIAGNADDIYWHTYLLGVSTKLPTQ